MSNLFKRRHKPQGRYTPSLWSVWLVVPLALLVVGALAFGLYHGAATLLTAENTSKNPINAQDNIKTTVTVITLIGAVLAGVYAYRKQRLAEGDSHRADASQLAERYSTAAEQLGHEQAAVRLAGVYAMARLADDWPEQRQVCVDVLCAYLRMPYATDAAEAGFKQGEREVRLTIIRTIRDHLRDPAPPTTWCGFDLDFTGATFDGGDFTRARFSGGKVQFKEARFSGGEVRFMEAMFSGGTVDFSWARFSGSAVDFGAAQFTGGDVTFGAAQFTGGEVNFIDTEFSGGDVAFSSAKFSGGDVAFSSAKFSGSTVSFRGSKVTDGRIHFFNATFSGGEVDFGSPYILLNTEFSGGEIIFDEAKFIGSRLYFDKTAFSGAEVNFSEAIFSGGTVDFGGARFTGGQIDFRDATHHGDAVTFTNARIHHAATIDWGPFPAIPPNLP